jgi:hypothetical protein
MKKRLIWRVMMLPAIGLMGSCHDSAPQVVAGVDVKTEVPSDTEARLEILGKVPPILNESNLALEASKLGIAHLVVYEKLKLEATSEKKADAALFAGSDKAKEALGDLEADQLKLQENSNKLIELSRQLSLPGADLAKASADIEAIGTAIPAMKAEAEKDKAAAIELAESAAVIWNNPSNGITDWSARRYTGAKDKKLVETYLEKEAQ